MTTEQAAVKVSAEALERLGWGVALFVVLVVACLLLVAYGAIATPSWHRERQDRKAVQRFFSGQDARRKVGGARG
jgi:predicted lysophospholipase L1 biosynthesis ABC-type transport system permease subunit